MGDTEEWKEANAKLEEKKQELSRQIELSLRLGSWGGEWSNFEAYKIWISYGETRRRVNVENKLPTILAEGENGDDFGTAVSKDFGNGGDRITLPEQQETNIDEKALRNVELVVCVGGPEMPLWAILRGSWGGTS